MELDAIFIDSAARRLAQFHQRIGQCATLLTDEQLWARGSQNENAIANLILHLTGNVRQWILSGVGGQPDNRQRDMEFAATSGLTREELLGALRQTVDEAINIIRAQTSETLTAEVTIQNYTVSKLEAVFHAVEHFALHTGQVIFATKFLTQQDLGFYRHLNKSAPSTHSEKTP